MVAVSMFLMPIAAPEVLDGSVVVVPVGMLVILGHVPAVSEARIEMAIYVSAEMVAAVIPPTPPHEHSV